MAKILLFLSIGGMALFGVQYGVTHMDRVMTVMGKGEVSTPVPITSLEGGEAATNTLLVATSSAATLDAMMTATSTVRIVTHKEIPREVKAFYMTSWVAGTKSARERLIKAAEETHINTFIIDVKDNTGVVSWDGRIKKDDLAALIDDLHARGFYLIARVTAFQDPLFAKENPSEAIHRTDGSLWKSKKGEAWVDPGSQKMWDYLLSLGKESYALGFDEINYDYIRYSTDGLKENLVFPQSKEKGKSGRKEIISSFYAYITGELQKDHIPVSGDVFGIITTSTEDTSVLGQDFAVALSYFDYVAPMVYPSHYAAGTFGFQNPAAHPGPVITESLKGALKIADSVASSTGVATSSLYGKIRPWYQDFNMGAVYTADMIKAQIDAGKKLGIPSYMMWDPNNKYTLSAYK